MTPESDYQSDLDRQARIEALIAQCEAGDDDGWADTALQCCDGDMRSYLVEIGGIVFNRQRSAESRVLELESMLRTFIERYAETEVTR